MDNSTTVQYAGLLHQLTMKAKSTVRDIDPQNDLTFLRIRSKKHEIMVAPGNLAHLISHFRHLSTLLDKGFVSQRMGIVGFNMHYDTSRSSVIK